MKKRMALLLLLIYIFSLMAGFGMPDVMADGTVNTTYEFEDMTLLQSTAQSVVRETLQGKTYMRVTSASGTTGVEYEFHVQEGGRYNIGIDFLVHEIGSYTQIFWSIDGTRVYSTNIVAAQTAYIGRDIENLMLGNYALGAGKHTIKIELVYAGRMVSLDKMTLFKSYDVTENLCFTDHTRILSGNEQVTRNMTDLYPTAVFSPTAPGAALRFVVEAPENGNYEASALVKYGTNAGIYALYVNGVMIGAPAHFHTAWEWKKAEFGDAFLRKGENEIELRCLGGNTEYRLTISNVSFRAIADELFGFEAPENPPVMKRIYVSTAGNDNGAGTVADPVQTIKRAIAIAKQYNRNMTGNIEIILGGGTYVPKRMGRERPLYTYVNTVQTNAGGDFTISAQRTLRETMEVSGSELLIDEALSGTNGYQVIFKSADGETAQISGGRMIEGWALHDQAKNIYVADAPNLVTRQLVVNGKKAVRARSTFDLYNSCDLLGNCKTTEYGHLTDFTEILSWRNISEVEFVYTKPSAWYSPRVKVASVAPAGNSAKIVMQNPAWSYIYNIPRGGLPGSTNYPPAYIENAYELLDEAGEWYLDQAAGKLYYKPLEHEDMATAVVCAPVLEELVSISGSSENAKVKNIAFENIVFQDTTWMRPSSDNGFCDCQSGLIYEDHSTEYDHYEMPEAAVRVSNAFGISFRGCTFRQLGGDGLLLEKGCSDVEITGNVFEDISGTAVCAAGVGKAERGPTSRGSITRNIKISNNRICDVANEYYSSVAVRIGMASHVEITHNDISNISYSALHVGWGIYTDEEAAAAYRYGLMKNMKIEQNLIYHTNKILMDGAPIYVRGRTGATAHDPNTIKGNYTARKGTIGYCNVYFDCGYGYWLAENNFLSASPVAFGGNAIKSELLGRGNYSIDYDGKSVRDCEYSEENIAAITGEPTASALDIIRNAGIEAAYASIRPGEHDELFMLVPAQNMIASQSGKKTKLTCFAYNGAAEAVDDVTYTYYEGAYFTGRAYEYTQLMNGLLPEIQDCDRYTFDSRTGEFVFKRPQKTVFWVKGEKNGVCAYTRILVCVGTFFETSDLEKSFSEGVTMVTSSAFPFYDFPKIATVGESVSYTIEIPEAGTYDLYAGNPRTEYDKALGSFSVRVNDVAVGSGIDFYESTDYMHYLGQYHAASGGSHVVTFTSDGKNSEATGYRLALDAICIEQTKPASDRIAICGSFDGLNNQPIAIKVTDETGVTVYEAQKDSDGNGKVTFDFRLAPNGPAQYTYRLTGKGLSPAYSDSFTLREQGCGVEIIGYTFTDGAGEKLIFDRNCTSVTATFRLEAPDTKELMLIALFLSADGRIVGKHMSECSVYGDDRVSVSANVPRDAALLKVCLWEQGTLCPIMEAKLAEVKQHAVMVHINY